VFLRYLLSYAEECSLRAGPAHRQGVLGAGVVIWFVGKIGLEATLEAEMAGALGAA
jgi:hypothetical protein